MPVNILITQCLQNDFVLPLGIHDPLPNKLHIGYHESKRLMGEFPREGMLFKLMESAYATPAQDLTVINIRDWHDANDPAQQQHLQQFGAHCIMHTPGADFVFEDLRQTANEKLVNATGLNDFEGTTLQTLLDPFKNEQVNVGIVGVWTEAKVTYLAYELASRYPHFNLAVCSALTASSSTHLHYISLDQLKRLLGVRIIPSVTEFGKFLGIQVGGAEEEVSVKDKQHAFTYNGKLSLKPEDETLIHYLYRNAHQSHFNVLDGGYSGNVVMKAKSIDVHGHEEVPTVIKIGERNAIAGEKDSFEKIKDVLGNNAPSIVEYMETSQRAGIKYRYASMFDEKVSTFQHFYGTQEDTTRINWYLDVVFIKQLGRFYKAASLEKLNLLEYYDFSPRYAGNVQKRVEGIYGSAVAGKENLWINEREVYNVTNFYARDLAAMNVEALTHAHYMAYVHGDLNGANIIIDAQNNVWLIDFFHTHRGHVLKDLVKLENDITYIFTKINSKAEWQEAALFIDALMEVDDLLAPLPQRAFKLPDLNKAYATIGHLRSLYKNLIDTDRNPFQLWVAQLRYAVHTLSFDECNDWQKQLALYASGKLAEKINQYYHSSTRLRIDYLPEKLSLLGMTILPGRKDRNRQLEEDLLTLKEEKIASIVSLVTSEELAHYGVEKLVEQYRAHGMDVKHVNIVDQGTPTTQEMQAITAYMHESLGRGNKTLVHCVGGIGRTGTAVACYLKQYHGLSADDAIHLVRQWRSPRAVENKVQETFVEQYGE